MNSDPATWIGRDLPPIWHNGEAYFVLGHAGSIYLVRNHCPHRGGPLKFGHVQDDEIVCPMHHNTFSIATLIAQATTVTLMMDGA